MASKKQPSRFVALNAFAISCWHLALPQLPSAHRLRSLHTCISPPPVLQLDKFGQQLGERLNLQQSKRTDLSDTFRDLEGSVELRRLGTERLAISSRDYLKGFKKEKIQDGSVLPIELLGLNQLTYGTDLGESDYGQ